MFIHFVRKLMHRCLACAKPSAKTLKFLAAKLELTEPQARLARRVSITFNRAGLPARIHFEFLATPTDFFASAFDSRLV